MPEELGDREMLLNLVDKLYEEFARPLRGTTTDEYVSEKLRRDLELGVRIAQVKAVADRIRRM